ncbi:MAG: hypothetical protein ACLT4Y_08830 [Bifidobacterium breve]
MRLSARLDKELNRTEDKVLLRSYPTLAFKSALTDPKTKLLTLTMWMPRSTPATPTRSAWRATTARGPAQRDDRHDAATDGAVMNKPERTDRAGRAARAPFGIIPQLRPARRSERREERALCDGRLRAHLPQPKPVIARELLHCVHFGTETPNAPVGKLPVVQQRLVAIARAMACRRRSSSPTSQPAAWTWTTASP